MADEQLTTIDLDFGDSDPVQKMGGSSDHVPEGPYRWRVDSAQVVKTKKGDPMVVVTSRITNGEFEGKRVQDRFAFTKDSTFGRDRFHGFLAALTGKNLRGQRIPAFDPKSLESREFVGEVQDNEFESNSGQIIVNSSFVSYYHVQSQEARELFQPRGSRPAAPAAPAPAATPAPAPAAPAPVAAATEPEPIGDPFEGDAGEAVGVGADVSAEVENIFG